MSLESIKRRNQEDRAKGVVRTYKHEPVQAPAPTPQAPAAPPPPPYKKCIHEGVIIAPCHSCGSEMRHVRDCELHGTCTRVEAGKDVDAVCTKCPDYDNGEPPGLAPVVVEQGAGGLGDTILGLVVVAQLSAQQPAPVEYRVAREWIPWAALFDGYAKLHPHSRGHNESPVPGAVQMNAGYTQENLQRYAAPRWERYARNIGASGVTIPKLKDPERVAAAGADLAGCVCLCPFSTDRAREWSVHHWLTLEGQLVAAGYRTAVFHTDDKALGAFVGTKVTGQSAERVAGAFLNALCVIGTDSGLPHLSGVLGAPTIVLGGSTPVEKIFGCYPNVTCVQGGLSCSGCSGGTGVTVGHGYTERCLTSCSNLQSIAPGRVIREVDRIAFAAVTEGLSLIGPERLAVIRDAVRATNHLAGEVAECGSFRGGSARVIARHAAGAPLHVFDAGGIPEDDAAGGLHKRGDFETPEGDLRAALADENVVFHLGVFPETTAEIPDETVFRFVHLDMDTQQATAAGLEYFWPRMVPGGIIVLDDLDFENCPGVRLALSSVLPGVPVESPERGQGLIRKPPDGPHMDPHPTRLEAIPETVPFFEYTAADDAEQRRHLDEDLSLYQKGKPRYICSHLGVLHQELENTRPDLAALVREVAFMARRMNDFGVSQDALDRTTPREDPAAPDSERA